MAEIESATGTRPPGCPWAALTDEYVQHVIRAHKWSAKGELHLKWGHDPPLALTLGLETFSNALISTENHDAEKRRDERERKAAADAAGAPHQARPSGRRPIPTRR